MLCRLNPRAVSYTHLDVYKRQISYIKLLNCVCVCVCTVACAPFIDGV